MVARVMPGGTPEIVPSQPPPLPSPFWDFMVGYRTNRGASIHDPGKVTFTSDAEFIRIGFAAEGMGAAGRALFIAFETNILTGCAVVPYQQHAEGSTVFLPFRADRFYAVRIEPDGRPTLWWREWQGTHWSPHLNAPAEFRAEVEAGQVRIVIPFRMLPGADASGRGLFTVWAKDLHVNDGWGLMLGEKTSGTPAMIGDVALRYVFSTEKTPLFPGHHAARMTMTHESPLELEASPAKRGLSSTSNTTRPRIYQLLPRLFSNTNETRKPNGTMAENGVGKFADLNDTVLKAIREEMGATHVWLTGVLAQATSMDYSQIGKPADDPDLLKGLAGSPYAIKDYTDVCPDYASPAALKADAKTRANAGSNMTACSPRLEEFRELIARAHQAGLRVIIDFVPNHVARSHASQFVSFGHHDDPKTFFSAKNNFFWLQHDSPGGGPPLRLPTVRDGQCLSPTCAVLGAGDGLFPPETTTGRVTGNNACTWSPSQNDWYETVKLNYGYDFTTGRREYPHAGAPDLPVPDTWEKMDYVLRHWQGLGVDGFRCDMAHMVPPEFWNWVITRARQRNPAVYFVAEAYNNDPMKVEGGYDLLAHFHNVMIELLNAGFDAVYDDPAYKTLKGIYDSSAWANDLDGVLAAQGPYVFPNSLRYAENHDEVRLASKGNWGGVGMDVGRAVSGVLYGISTGPVLLHSGQEVGEPAEGAEGFGSDNGRTTIFDYWSMPELAKWINGHRYDGGRLSPQQKELRAFYGRLLKACGEPAFADGAFFPLNGANQDNPDFGRLGEHASGHWLYAYLRADARSGSAFLVVVNLHRGESMRNVRVRFSDEARAALPQGGEIKLVDRVGGLKAVRIACGEIASGIAIPEVPPLTAAYFEITAER